MAKPVKKGQRAPRQRRNQSKQSTSIRLRFSFACEGSTEVKYLTQALGVEPFGSALAVTAKAAKASSVSSLIRKAHELEKSPGKGKHYVWIVCDRDFRTEPEKIALQKWVEGSTPNVMRRLAFSNLCLEYWLLLYCLDAPSKWQKPEEYVAALTRELPGYSKEKRSRLPSELLDVDRLAMAIRRCQERQTNTGYTGASPSAQMQKLWTTGNLSNMSEVFDEAYKTVAEVNGTPGG